MSRFAFIGRSEFRTLLESDYRELQSCLDHRAWKAVHVIGGSIVESLLIDYLIEKPELIAGTKSATELDLGRAVGICRSNSVISERVADLCSVVKSYRNLIHPGRQVRLNEPAPSESSARIVYALLDLIIAEIADAREASFGLTAEQFLFKLERDPKSLVLVPHLLPDMQSSELERLLTDVLPNRCTELYLRISDDEPYEDLDMLFRIGQAYHKAFASAAEPIKIRVAAQLPSILRSGDGDMVTMYSRHLFRVPYLEYVSGRDRSMVKDYFVSEIPAELDEYSAEQSSDLIVYLEPNNVGPWLDPFVRAISSRKAAPGKTSAIRKALMKAAGHSPSEEINADIEKRFNDWIRHFENRGQSDQAAVLTSLRDEFFEESIIF